MSTKLGGSFAIAVGVLIVVLNLMFTFLPEDQKDWTAPEFVEAYARRPAPVAVFGLLSGVNALIAIAVVLSVRQYVGESNEFLRWVTYLAIIGRSVEAIQQLRYVGLMPFVLVALRDGFQHAATIHIWFWPDMLHIFRFGLVGLWTLAVNVLALKNGSLNRAHAVIGIVAGVGYWLGMAGFISGSTVVGWIAIIVGIFFAPIWFIWLGVQLLKGLMPIHP